MGDTSESHHNQHEEFGVLPTYAGGGPKGLGDPEDRSIRKLENELVVQKMRDESKKLCVDENKVFAECLKTGGFLFFVRCFSASQELKRCQLRWFHDEEFEKKVKDMYLEERSEYRRTGITKKEREWREKEFKEWVNHKHEPEHTNSQTT